MQHEIRLEDEVGNGPWEEPAFCPSLWRPPGLEQVLQSTIWHRAGADRVTHRHWPFPKITSQCKLRAPCAPHPQEVPSLV